MSQWVVRMLGKTVLLPANITSIEALQNDDFMELLPTVTDAYVRTLAEADNDAIDAPEFWVCIRYNDVCVQTGAMLPRFTVLCEVATMLTAERIIRTLTQAMFSQYLVDVFVDLYALLRADSDFGFAMAQLPTKQEPRPQTGRFIDLDETGVAQSVPSRRQGRADTDAIFKRIADAIIIQEFAEHTPESRDTEAVERNMQVDRARSLSNPDRRSGVLTTTQASGVVAATSTSLPATPLQRNVGGATVAPLGQTVRAPGWIQSIGSGVVRQAAEQFMVQGGVFRGVDRGRDDLVSEADMVAAMVNEERRMRDREQPADL